MLEILAAAGLLLTSANGQNPILVLASGGEQCSYATISEADRRRYQSRYNRRVREYGRDVAEEWLRSWLCPSAELQAERAERRKANALTDRNGRPCTRTRAEMRAVSGMDGSMTMIPVQVCAD